MANKKEKTLVIVESPAKSKTIKKILGDGYQIEASYGHIRNLPTKDPKTDNLGFDVENNFEPKFEIIPQKKEVVRKLNDLAKSVIEKNTIKYKKSIKSNAKFFSICILLKYFNFIISYNIFYQEIFLIILNP